MTARKDEHFMSNLKIKKNMKLNVIEINQNPNNSDTATLKLSDGIITLKIEITTTGFLMYHLIKEVNKDRSDFTLFKYHEQWIKEHNIPTEIQYFCEIFLFTKESYKRLPEDIALKQGYTELKKIHVYPKGFDDRFITIPPASTNYVWVNPDTKKAVFAETKNGEIIKTFGYNPNQNEPRNKPSRKKKIKK